MDITISICISRVSYELIVPKMFILVKCPRGVPRIMLTHLPGISQNV